MDNTNHTEPKTTAPMRELTDDELRVVAGESLRWRLLRISRTLGKCHGSITLINLAPS